MKERNSVVVRSAESEKVIVFDEDKVREELENSLKQFGRGVCSSGENSLAPLADFLVRSFFRWVKDSFLQ